MNCGLLIIAHAPLASALRQCMQHVFPDAAQEVVAMDVDSDLEFDILLVQARKAMAELNTPQVLMFTDVFGATPCNVAQKLVDTDRVRLIAGVNLPMLLRAMTYRGEPLETLVERAVAGGVQGVTTVAVAAPQHQARRMHDQDPNDHQQ